MKKKKLVKIVIGVLALILVITGAILVAKKMKRNTEISSQENSNVVTPVSDSVNQIEINQNYNVSEGMKSALAETRLNEYLDGEQPKERNESDIVINFSDLAGVTVEQMGDITEDSITAVYLVKMGNANQYNEIYKRIQNKLQELKRKYADNKAISTILSYDENVVVRQVQGMVIGTFAPDAGALNFGLEQTIHEQNQKLEEKRMEEERRKEETKPSEEE